MRSAASRLLLVLPIALLGACSQVTIRSNSVLPPNGSARVTIFGDKARTQITNFGPEAIDYEFENRDGIRFIGWTLAPNQTWTRTFPGPQDTALLYNTGSESTRFGVTVRGGQDPAVQIQIIGEQDPASPRQDLPTAVERIQ